MVERSVVLRETRIARGSRVLEVGSGAHAITTIPLAYRVGSQGRVIAAERARWNEFRSIVELSGLGARVDPVACDARTLPLRDDSCDLAVCVHGIRSLGGDARIIAVVREMLRAAPRLLVAETLPSGRTAAQRAHLGMYGLREEVLRLATGRTDDRPYVPVGRLAELCQRAGATVESTRTIDVDLPHALAYFPRDLVEGISEPRARADLLRRWDRAYSDLLRYGEDHPAVGIVLARRD